jgi:anti-sigma regulatory factor (Ser/Thr protein kinase)
MTTQTKGLDQLDMACFAAGTVAAEVRHRIGLRLAGWSLNGVAGDVQLIAAELVANACEATPDGQIWIRFFREPSALYLSVWDESDRMPEPRPVEDLTLDDLDLSPENFDCNGGRGLQLVQALSSECGVTRTQPRGKWVWSRVRI